MLIQVNLPQQINPMLCLKLLNNHRHLLQSSFSIILELWNLLKGLKFNCLNIPSKELLNLQRIHLLLCDIKLLPIYKDLIFCCQNHLALICQFLWLLPGEHVNRWVDLNLLETCKVLLELFELVEEGLVRSVLDQEKSWDRSLGVVVDFPEVH